MYWVDSRDLATVNQEKPPLHEIVRAIEEALAAKGRWLTNISVRRPPHEWGLLGFNFFPGWLVPFPSEDMPNYHRNETSCSANTLDDALAFIAQLDEARLPNNIVGD